MADYRQFKNPNCPAAYSARLAYELKTKRSLKTGKRLSNTQLAFRSGALSMREYETNWYNSVGKKYNQLKNKDNFMQHDFTNFDFAGLYDDLDNVRLSKK